MVDILAMRGCCEITERLLVTYNSGRRLLNGIDALKRPIERMMRSRVHREAFMVNALVHSLTFALIVDLLNRFKPPAAMRW
jgi:hypothetical protein